MDPYVAALVIIAAVTFMIIMSLHMIEKTMRIENLDFTLDEPLCEELQTEAQEDEAKEDEAQEDEEKEDEAQEDDAQEDEAQEDEAQEDEAQEDEAQENEAPETLEADSPDLTLDTGENIVVLTPNEKIIVNKLFSHTIGQLLKIRLENERRRKLE
jgi:cobalamin biosynthesis protein CobT